MPGKLPLQAFSQKTVAQIRTVPNIDERDLHNRIRPYTTELTVRTNERPVQVPLQHPTYLHRPVPASSSPRFAEA